VVVKTDSTTVSVRAPKRLGFVDVTEELLRAVKDSGVTTGLVAAFCSHTTCTLLLNEWEDGALDDLAQRLEVLVPGGIYYAHDDLDRRTQNVQETGEPENGQAHVIQMVVGGASHTLPVAGGEPLLGRWQRLFLLELDEPRNRNIVFTVLGD